MLLSGAADLLGIQAHVVGAGEHLLERRLDAEIAERYGPGRTLADVSQAWRPYRTWAAVHLRALREQRTGEISGR